ncbi:MAG TPA: site-2 protease family protein [Ktedonobacterales bacterium]|nr:site-2 protease family protein [Ktedonobacterales bacterium]
MFGTPEKPGGDSPANPMTDNVPPPPPASTSYPPPPDYYRTPARAASATRRCEWCGQTSPAGATHCTTCGALLPPPEQPRYWTATEGAYPPPATAAQYPQYAPNGKVDPRLMRQTEAGQGRRGSRGGTAVGVGSAVVAGASKFALVAKFALPLVSALASVGAYGLLFGWQFGIGLVALLFVHEMGHVLVIRAKGLPASLPVFIPLLGAAVFMRRMPLNVKDEAEIAIAGPLAGSVAAAACYAFYLQGGPTLWLSLAYIGFFLNLFNLIPVSPLDGGRVAGAISRWIWPIGIVALVVLFFYTHSFVILIVGWLGFFQTIARFRDSATGNRYYQMNLGPRIAITLLYFGLAIGLALAMMDTQHLLHLTGTPAFGH